MYHPVKGKYRAPNAAQGRVSGLIASGVLLLAACSGGSEAGDAAVAVTPDASTTLPLVDVRGWQRYAASLDALPSHQPAMIDCGVAGVYVEYGNLEVDTGYCNYVLAQAPALVSIDKGARVELELQHFDLTAPMPAEAHVAIFFGKDLQWETHVPIPHAAEIQHVHWAATRALAAGEPVRLHLHNHGQNNWAIGYLRVRE